MRILIPDKLAKLARVFSDAGVSAYLVGGYVRNVLLGLPPSDIDIASALLPDEVVALCRERGMRVIEKAKEMGTVELHAYGLSVEHTTFRADTYAQGGHHRPDSVRLGGTLESDAFRRDFTVNALYADLATGAVADPTGGLLDLDRRLIRTTSRDPDDILRSDAVRVLRLVRFACELGFMIDDDTFAAAGRNAGGLSDIAEERKRAELEKILLSDARYGEPGAVLKALRLLEQLGAWEYVIPELLEGRGVQQLRSLHRYTVLEHAFHACQAAPAELDLRLAGLLHDVGKPEMLKNTGRFLGHDRRGADMARAILQRLRFSNAVTEHVTALVQWHMYDVQGTAKEMTLKRRFAEWGRAFCRDMIAMRETDIRGCGSDDGYVAVKWRALYERMQAEQVPFSVAELAIDGADVMRALGVGPSPAVGAKLDALWRHCVLKPADNTKEKLMRLVKTI